MAKKIFIFIFLFLLVVLQVSVLPNFFAPQRIPDLVLLALIFFAVRRNFEEVWGIAIAGGFLLDLFSFFPIGVNIFSFLLLVWAMSFLTQRFLATYSTWKFITLIFLVIMGTVMNDFIVMILIKIIGLNARGVAMLGHDFWLKIFNNLLTFGAAYWPLKKFENLRNLYGQKIILRNNVR